MTDIDEMVRAGREQGEALNKDRYGEYVVVQTQGVGGQAKTQLFRARANDLEEIEKLRSDVIGFLDSLLPQP